MILEPFLNTFGLKLFTIVVFLGGSEFLGCYYEISSPLGYFKIGCFSKNKIIMLI